ncbi:MAG: hypothetical protein Q9160_000846 [Pyrenula sp. 1 TL-2023]
MDADQATTPIPSDLKRTKSLKRKHESGPTPSKQKKLKQSQPESAHLNKKLRNGNSLPLTPDQSQISDGTISGTAEEPDTSQFLDAYDNTHAAVADFPSISEELTSSFFQKRTSLYVSLPPISINQSNATSSLIALHLTPLLLTFFPPLDGVIVSFSDVTISEEPVSDKIDTHTIAACREEKAVSFIWLTVTFLVLSPQPGDVLDGALSVNSVNFVGLALYSFFPVSIGGDRIPKSWTWHPPLGSEEETKKKPRTRSISLKSSSPAEHISDNEDGDTSSSSSNGEDEDENATSSSETTLRATSVPSSAGSIKSTNTSFNSALENQGHFTYSTSSTESAPIPEILRFRVLDTIITPGLTVGTFSLQIEGSLLSEEEEKQAVEEDRKRWERREAGRLEKIQGRRKREAAGFEMSGALGESRSRSRSRSRRMSSDGLMNVDSDL